MREWSRRYPTAGRGGEVVVDDEPERLSAGTRPVRERRRAWVPLAILGCGLALLLYSMQLGSFTTSGYDLQRLQSERDEWRQRNAQLDLELAKAQSLAWIEVEAVQRLGMQKAQHVTYLEVAPAAEVATDQGVSATVAAAPSAAARDGAAALPDVLGLWRGLLAQIVPPIDAGP